MLAMVVACAVRASVGEGGACVCSGAGLYYGSVCASWDAVDEEPWCRVASSTACGAEGTFKSTAGHFWAYAPCKDKPKGRPKSLPKVTQAAKLAFEKYLDANSYTVVRLLPKNRAPTSGSAPVPAPRGLSVPGKAAYKKLPVVEQNRIRVKSLVAVSAALEAAGCAHHVIEGTLLGLVRNRALIPHDSDDDLAVYGCTDDASLHTVLAKLEPQGFSLCRRQGPLWSICREGGYIDIEHWRAADGGVCRYDDGKGGAWELTPCAFVFPIVKMSLASNSTAENAVLRLPRPFSPEKVLELFYGTGWRVPSSKHAGGISASKVKQLAAELTPGAAQLAAALSQGVSLSL